MIDIIYSETSEVVAGASHYINTLLNKYYNNHILLMFSGGSSFAILPYLHAEKLSNYITLSVVDERYTTDPTANNFCVLQHSKFYRIALLRGCKFIDTRVREDTTHALHARSFENDLRRWHHDYPDGKVIITQGIGIDGHTAGIMPYPSDPSQFERIFDNELVWVEAYDSSDKSEYPIRVTVTFPFLRNMVDHSILYVVGEEKRDILKKTLISYSDLHIIPAAIIHKMKDVRIFIDIKL